MKKILMIGILVLVFVYPSTGNEKMEVLEKKSQFYFYRVKKGQTLWDLFGLNWKIIAKINKVSPERIRPGMNLMVPYDFEWAEKEYSPLPREIPKKERKFILVDLEKQALVAYEFGKLKFWYPISSGKPRHETPKGEFQILARDKNRFSSIYNTSMKYALKFLGDYHGDYWFHVGDLLGYPASHGCIRLFEEDCRKLYSWAEIKTKVEIR